MNKTAVQNPIALYGGLLLSGVAHYLLAYHTERENFLQVLALFAGLFALFVFLYQNFSATHWKSLLLAGLLFRVLLLFSLPQLSDDVYRFLWDGRLSAAGINPFSHLPSEVVQMPPVEGITPELYRQLNSPHYYTIYPPVLQGIFWTAGKLFPVYVPGAILFLKTVIVLFEAAAVYLLLQLLKKLSLPKSTSLLYVLNPLVIAELTGNVHFEGVMLFFVLLAIWLLLQQKIYGSALALALGIATKLLPVLFLPLLVHRLGWKKGMLYAAVTGMATLLLFALLFDRATLLHLLNSVELFFRRFEFNASLYYAVRWVTTALSGYNLIAYTGPLLSVAALGGIVYFSFRKRLTSPTHFFCTAAAVPLIWFLLATTVHPWYLVLPLALSVFTPYRFVVLWSFTAIFSYAAYATTPVRESGWWIAAEYGVVLAYFFAEWKREQRKATGNSMD